MTGYLRRLATTGAAYTASSVISKLIAVALLPLYTRYLTPADYGAAEVLVTGVIAASIIIRLGIIEALLRFYYQAGEEPNQVVKTAFASLLWTTTIGLAVALPLAEPLSRLLLGHSDASLMRIAIFGLWVFTMFEFLTTLYRLDERAKAYFVFTVANVLVTIPVTVWLVVGEQQGRERPALGPVRHGGGLPRGPGDRPAAAPRRRPGLRSLAPHAPLGPADDAGGALALLPQLHRPGADRPDPRAG